MKEFRSDINGLRCLAVLAVLLYHLGTPGFPGGYVGVDVFFVISGYLMTEMILSRVRNDSFSLFEFWLSRARRIIPALYILLVAILAFGWFWLPSHYYQLLARYAVASVLFVSNILFNDEAGNYFAEPSRDNWLLHTWSLSVEWQFYLLYPLVLLAAARALDRSSRTIPTVLGVWFSLSLAWCLYQSQIFQSYAFYSLSARTWEFLAGAFVFFLPPRFKPGRAATPGIQSAGLLIILLSVILFQDSMPWPAYYAIIPVTGAALVIAADHRHALWSGNLIVESIGKWSYSIYLWHWPIIVGLGLFEVQASGLVQVLVLLCSILVGGLSYHWIENPIRGGKWKPVQGLSIAVIAIGSMVTAGLMIMHNKVSPGWAPFVAAMEDEEIKSLSIGDCSSGLVEGLLECMLGNRKYVAAVVWGDSHAQAVISVIARAAVVHGKGVLYFSMTGCPPISTARISGPDRNRDRDCVSFNENVLKRFQYRKDLPVIIVGRFSDYLKNNEVYFGDHAAPSAEELRGPFKRHLVGSLCALATDRKVFVVKPIPEMEVNVSKRNLISLRLNETADDIFIRHDDYIRQNTVVLSALDTAKVECGITLLDPVPYLCEDGKCYGSLNGIPLYSDDNHLNAHGDRLLFPLFDEIFN